LYKLCDVVEAFGLPSVELSEAWCHLGNWIKRRERDAPGLAPFVRDKAARDFVHGQRSTDESF
jgi:hypothetical protein